MCHGAKPEMRLNRIAFQQPQCRLSLLSLHRMVHESDELTYWPAREEEVQQPVRIAPLTEHRAPPFFWRAAPTKSCFPPREHKKWLDLICIHFRP